MCTHGCIYFFIELFRAGKMGMRTEKPRAARWGIILFMCTANISEIESLRSSLTSWLDYRVHGLMNSLNINITKARITTIN